MGDKVLLRVGKGKQLYLNLPRHSEHPKLQAKFVGPFSVKEKVSNLAYRLELPTYFKAHSVFHVDRLKRRMDARRVKRPVVEPYVPTMQRPLKSKGFSITEKGSVERSLLRNTSWFGRTIRCPMLCGSPKEICIVKTWLPSFGKTVEVLAVQTEETL